MSESGEGDWEAVGEDASGVFAGEDEGLGV